MVFNKEKEILKFAERFLYILSERCLKECGSTLPSFHYPVFKKFLMYRTKREFQFYKKCLDVASAMVSANCRISDHDVEDVVVDSIYLDDCLKRDIMLLPIRFCFDYDRILPLRRERIKKQIDLFRRFLSTGDVRDYNEMVRAAISEKDYATVNNELLELYAEEAYLVNSSLTSLVTVDSVVIAERIHCSMLDVGIGLNREIARKIYAHQAKINL